MGKIIFIDVDGTLVDFENNLPKSAIKAIREARKNGHRVYIRQAVAKQRSIKIFGILDRMV